MIREWRDVTGFVGRYQVSNDGFVRSLPDIDARGRFMPGEILSMTPTDKGYLRVTLDRESHRLHVIVALAFIPNPEAKPQVNHKNGIKSDCRADNLEWSTNSENQEHRYRVLGQVSHLAGKTGAACPNSKPVVGLNLTTREVRRFAAAAEAARDLGVHSSGVSACAAGKLRTYRGWQWQYE